MENFGFLLNGPTAYAIAEIFADVFWRRTKLGIALSKRLSLADDSTTWSKVHVVALKGEQVVEPYTLYRKPKS